MDGTKISLKTESSLNRLHLTWSSQEEVCQIVKFSCWIWKFYSPLTFYRIYVFKAHIFWEGHKVLRNLHQLFVLRTASQIIAGDFAKFCGLLRIYEFYIPSWVRVALFNACKIRLGKSLWIQTCLNTHVFFKIN